MRLGADDKRILQELPEDARISDEYKRLRELYADITGNRLKLVLKLVSQAAFMSVTLANLADYISKNGCTEEYQNGENQWGKKKSSEVDVYNTMVKNYASVIKQLTELLPKAGINEGDDGFDAHKASR